MSFKFLTNRLNINYDLYETEEFAFAYAGQIFYEPNFFLPVRYLYYKNRMTGAIIRGPRIGVDDICWDELRQRDRNEMF